MFMREGAPCRRGEDFDADPRVSDTWPTFRASPLYDDSDWAQTRIGRHPVETIIMETTHPPPRPPVHPPRVSAIDELVVYPKPLPLNHPHTHPPTHADYRFLFGDHPPEPIKRLIDDGC